MRSASSARFVLFGAAGFGLGGPIAWSVGYYFPLLFDLSTLLVGAVGGASLGLALGDRRKLVVLALLGGLGTTLGLLVATILGSFVNYSLILLGAVFGTVLGASLGLAFLDLRRLVALVLAGAVGFGIGVPAGNALSFLAVSFEDLPAFSDAPFIFVAGVVGGGALGAALGYLQGREPAGRRVGRTPEGARVVERHRGSSETSFRAATREDSRKIAELFRISSDGVVDYVWMTLAPDYPGLEPVEIGATRYAHEEGNFSYTNCVLAELDGEVIGQLCTYPVEASVEDHEEPVDPILEPYARLEIPGTLYVSSLALFEEFRGMGLGTKMISLARDQARERGLDALSLLVFEQNTGAVKLYEREGFHEVDRAAVVPHPLINHTGDVILMTAPV